jgi:hypothetical protein
MDRRAFVRSLALGLVAAPLAAEAQQGGKVWRVGFLYPGTPSAAHRLAVAFREGLRDLGYVEQSVLMEYCSWKRGRLASQRWISAVWCVP